MAETKKVTLKRGQETLEVTTPTDAGLAALAKLGWQSDSESKQPARKPAAKK